MSGQKGFRVQPQAGRKEQIREMDAELKNLQMAGRISQMMIQQMMQNMKSLSDDLGSALNQIYELQYKQLALQTALNLNADDLNKIANEQRLKDFTEAAQKEDIKENLVAAAAVTEDSTVVLTSTAVDDKGNDKGIFRSRIKLSDSGVPALNQALMGKAVGDKVSVQLNGLEHMVELLNISNPAPEAQPVETTH